MQPLGGRLVCRMTYVASFSLSSQWSILSAIKFVILFTSILKIKWYFQNASFIYSAVMSLTPSVISMLNVMHSEAGQQAYVRAGKIWSHYELVWMAVNSLHCTALCYSIRCSVMLYRRTIEAIYSRPCAMVYSTRKHTLGVSTECQLVISQHKTV